MQIDEFLNARRISALQTLQWLWAPGTRRSSSKSELLRLLRRQMLSPERIRESFHDLADTQKDFLRGLLRLEDYRGDVEFLLARLADPPATHQARREITDELARRGFIHCTIAPGWGSTESLQAIVPRELGDGLADVLNLDTREAAVMMSLERALLELRPEELARTAGGATSVEEALADLTQPGAIAERIDALPEPAMRQAVRIALEHHAGILHLERFPSLGLDIESLDSPTWRTAIEDALLGTCGHLCLLEFGLSDDHECLVVYHEIVRAWAVSQAPEHPAIDHTYACGTDFLTDMMTVTDCVRAEPRKLTAAGRFFKGARNGIIPQLALHSTYFHDEESLLAYKLAVARSLGLLDVGNDARLHTTRAATAWENLHPERQLRDVWDTVLRIETSTHDQPHFADLAEAARHVLLDLGPGTWFPTGAFLALVLCRFLTRLLDQGPPPPGISDAPETVWGYPRPSSALAAIAAAARDPLLHALNCAGIIDIGRSADHSFVAATPLARVVLDGQPLPEPDERLIIVNPDFEVILFPDRGHHALLARLCPFCGREKSQVTHHLRITRESIRRAALRGIGPDDILATLGEHSRVPLSQNIEYSIRSWASQVHAAEIETLHVLELPSAEITEAAMQLPEVAPLIARRLSPTSLALSVPQLDPRAEEALKQLGIHLT